MRVFAICALVVFFVVKIAIYIGIFVSKRGYVTDYGHVLSSIVLPMMSLLTYIGCFYRISSVNVGFIVNIALSWLLLLVTLIVIKHLRYAFCYITAIDNKDGYKVADGVVKYISNLDSDILFDDNIGMGNSIKISFDRTKFSRQEMALLIDEQYAHIGAKKKIRKISLLALMVHSVEMILDLSFLINISMV